MAQLSSSAFFPGFGWYGRFGPKWADWEPAPMPEDDIGPYEEAMMRDRMKRNKK